MSTPKLVAHLSFSWYHDVEWHVSTHSRKLNTRESYPVPKSYHLFLLSHPPIPPLCSITTAVSWQRPSQSFLWSPMAASSYPACPQACPPSIYFHSTVRGIFLELSFLTGLPPCHLTLTSARNQKDFSQTQPLASPYPPHNSSHLRGWSQHNLWVPMRSVLCCRLFRPYSSL